ncbi:MAG: rod shape-determining protein, partial [Deltaproteobacteria bacterium]|nr:rod shape-determining protein [Deltaproteobacteria bacterium]
MKIGIVDLGTNSLRFDIYHISRTGEAELLYHKKDMIRLGEGVFMHKKFSPQAVQRVLKTMSTVCKIAQKHHVQKMVCCATSPFREAKDAADLLKKIKKQTGCTLRVLSGEKEAKLIAKGVLHLCPAPQKTVLIDIGGGSTEISICEGKKILSSKSLPLGSMRLQHIYLKKIPPTEKSIRELKKAVQASLQAHIPASFRKISCAIGSAGTVKALQKVTAPFHDTIDKKNLENFCIKIQSLKLVPLKRLLHTEGRRGDIILAGAILLLEMMNFFNLKSLSVVKRGLRDGL